MKSFTSLLVLLVGLGGSLAFADESAKASSKMEEASTDGMVTCTNGSDKRTLEKKPKEGGAGCDVIYTKGGEAKTIADANNDVSHCDKVIDKVKTTLTNSGFTCE